MLDEKASFPLFIALKVLHISEPLFYSRTPQSDFPAEPLLAFKILKCLVRIGSFAGGGEGAAAKLENHDCHRYYKSLLKIF